jgi:hypothetical protein
MSARSKSSGAEPSKIIFIIAPEDSVQKQMDDAVHRANADLQHLKSPGPIGSVIENIGSLGEASVQIADAIDLWEPLLDRIQGFVVLMDKVAEVIIFVLIT